MRMKKVILIILAFILFLLCWYNNVPIRVFEYNTDLQSLRYLLNYLISGLILLGALFILHKPNELIESMGMRKGFLKGCAMSFICVLPMLAGSIILGAYNDGLTVDHALRSIFIAGVFEEICFRGFLFGQLSRYAKLGFLWSASIPAILFGLLHIYQGNDVISCLMVFAVTLIGSLFFSWIYIEWDYNLWCSIGLHTLMNLSWILFPAEDNGAIGSIATNVFRVMTLLLAVVLTVRYKKRSGSKIFAYNIIKNG